MYLFFSGVIFVFQLQKSFLFLFVFYYLFYRSAPTLKHLLQHFPILLHELVLLYLVFIPIKVALLLLQIFLLLPHDQIYLAFYMAQFFLHYY